MTESTTFWQTLIQPILGLAPMDGVSDQPFRHIQKKYGRPTLVYTEFASVEGICSDDLRLLKDFLYDESQRPIIGQIFGRTPECYRQSAILLCQLGFDGIDINMGCPTKSVSQRGAGAGLIKTPLLAQEIVRAAKQGVLDWLNGATVRDCPDLSPGYIARAEARHALLPVAYQERRFVPVSVKTRIGFDRPQVEEWIPQILESQPAAVAIHGRTLDQAYSGKADWDQLAVAAELVRAAGVPMLGNGDVSSWEDAHRRVADYGVDGVLVGRASFGNPFVFRPVDEEPSEPYYRVHLALEHARFFHETFCNYERYHFHPMRKHLGWYAQKMPGAKYLRRELTRMSTLEEAEAAIEEYLDYRRSWEERNAGAPTTKLLFNLTGD